MKVMGALDPAGIRKGTKKGSIERKKNTKGEKVWKTKRKKHANMANHKGNS